MKWLLLLLPFWLQGQSLKPGIYYSLQTNQPLVLDTGCYTFVGLEMQPPTSPEGGLSNGIWLDARKARSLTLLHCTFEGNGSGTAVLSSGDLVISQCAFEKFEEGIVQQSPKGSHRKVAVLSNVFKDNGVAIRLAVERKVTGNVLVSSNQNLPYLFHHGTKVGAEATNELTYTGNQVTGFHFGLALHQESGGGNVAVRGNTFTDNRFGVYLEEGTMDMDFGCNQFRLSCMDEYPDNGPAVNNSSHPCYNEFTSGPDRVGLFVGEDAAIDGSIGGPGGISSSILPAGNVWPVGNKSQEEIALSSYELTGWVHPPNFTAVVNESEEDWSYFYFVNEFFNYQNNSTSGILVPEPTGRYARTSTDQEIPTALTGLVDLVCEDVFTSIVFPLLPRPATGNDLTATSNLLRVDKPVLGQNIPNPATHTTTISFYTPATVQKARLEVFELETGRLLKGFDILQPGNGAIEFETRSLPSGIFGYRLVVDGQPAAHKKMVISH